MSNLIFWQTVASIIVANTLCALTVYMVWRCRKVELRTAPKPSLWVYPFGLLAPALVIFASITLP